MSKKFCVIVSYNRPEKITTSVISCFKHGVTDLIIVDNMSDNVTINRLKNLDNSYSQLHIIYNDQNVGASKAFKIGADYVLDLSCNENDIITFLDDDSYINFDFYQKLNIPNIEDDFFISPKVTNLNGEILRMNQPLISLPNTFISAIKYAYKRPTPRNNNIEPVKTASFVGLTLKTKTLFKYIKYIREDFFIYYDDVFFTFKMSTNGVKGWYDPNLSVIHDTNDNKRTTSDLLLYYIIRNGVFTQKSMGKWWWLVEVPRMLYYITNVITKLNKIKIIFIAFKDGINLYNLK